MEFVAQMMARRVTLVLPTTMPGFGALEPTYLDGVAPGSLPDSGFPSSWNQPATNERESASGQAPGAAEPGGSASDPRSTGSPEANP
jgi:hypothetical protein